MKKILLTILALIAIGAGVAYYFYNKPHDTVEQHKGINITADKLNAAFATDEKSATTQYLGKVLVVSGKPSEVTKNDDGKTVLFFSDDGISGVQGTLRDKDVIIAVGQSVTIRGFCNGYTSVVLLSDCVVEK